jgi:hypothetical protein
MQDLADTGKRKGEGNNQARLTAKQAAVALAMKNLWPLQREIGEVFGVASTTIAHVQRRATWTHIEPAPADDVLVIVTCTIIAARRCIEQAPHVEPG